MLRRWFVERTGADVGMKQGRDHSFNAAMADASSDCARRADERRRSAVHPLHFGLHRRAKGRAAHDRRLSVWASMTHEMVFDYHDGDVYWCTADVGWVTGHSYIRLRTARQWRTNADVRRRARPIPTRPLLAGVRKAQVNQFYTAPTAIRALMGQGDEFVDKCDSRSLKLLGTVGEPINPEAWIGIRRGWRRTLPDRRHLVADRNRRHLLTPLPGATHLKARLCDESVFRRAAGDPRSDDGAELTSTEAEGVLCITDSLARPDAHCLRRSRPVCENLFLGF